jgi:hypothetical protein
MENTTEALKTALRVLTAITDDRKPDPADVEELKRLAPLMGDTPLDDLASDVIQQAFRRRSRDRDGHNRSSE